MPEHLSKKEEKALDKVKKAKVLKEKVKKLFKKGKME